MISSLRDIKKNSVQREKESSLNSNLRKSKVKNLGNLDIIFIGIAKKVPIWPFSSFLNFTSIIYPQHTFAKVLWLAVCPQLRQSTLCTSTISYRPS